MNYWAIISAAGQGKRYQMADQHAIPKQYLPLAGKTVIEYAAAPLLAHPLIKKIIVVVAPDDLQWSFSPLAEHPKILSALGGAERCHSVLNGLKALIDVAHADDWILVHDAARPLLQFADVEKLIAQCAEHNVGGLLGAPIHATLKRVIDHQVQTTVSRDNIWQALTPQMFRYALLSKALTSALTNKRIPSDDAQAIEALGYHPLMVQGESDNLKITYPGDLEWAEKRVGGR